MASGILVGVDIGTTAVKVSAFALGGTRPLATGMRDCPQTTEPFPGWQVKDTGRLVDVVLDAIRLCVAQVDPKEVRGLSLSAPLYGLVGFDAYDRPMTPLATWADSRAEEEATWLQEQGMAQDLRRATGMPVHPTSPLARLMWYARHEPETSGRVAWWGGPKEAVVVRLTGQRVTELSTASGTGLLDLTTRDWDPVATEIAQLDRTQLPEVESTTAAFPLTAEAAAALGLRQGTPVVLGAGDGPLGSLATGAITPGVAALSLGTAGSVRIVVPGPTHDERGSLSCHALTDELWVSGGAISNGSSAVRWAAQTFAPDLLATSSGQAEQNVLSLAEGARAGSDGLVMVPYLVGERAPLWDASIPGAYLGIRAPHRRQHFIRATLEGVCRQIAQVVDALGDEHGPITEVRATGNPFRFSLWQQVLAAHLDVPLRLASDAGGTSVGAAALGTYALGLADDLPAALALVGGSVAGDDDDSQLVVPRPGDVITYAQSRADLPHLVEQLESAAVSPTQQTKEHSWEPSSTWRN